MPSDPLPQQCPSSIEVPGHSESVPESLEPIGVQNQSKDNHQLHAVEDGDQHGCTWMKYDEELVQRIYYKCTDPNCQVKMTIERSHEGRTTKTELKEVHSHPKPSNCRFIGSSTMFTEESHDFSGREKSFTPKKTLDLLETNSEASNLENSQLDLRTSQNADGSSSNLLNPIVRFRPASSEQINCYYPRRQKFQKVLKLVCGRHRLPLARTWVPCLLPLFDQDSSNNNGDRCAYYRVKWGGYVDHKDSSLDFDVVDNDEHLLKGKGIVGEAFLNNKPSFSKDLTSCYKIKSTSQAKIAIPCYWNESIRPSDRTVPDYVVEFFLPLDCEVETILVSLTSMIAQHLCIVDKCELEQASGSRQGSDNGPIPLISGLTGVQQSTGTNDLLVLPTGGSNNIIFVLYRWNLLDFI